MRQTPLEKRIAALAAPIAGEMGFALVQVRLTGEGGGRTLQIMAENPETGTIGVDDCARLSRAIGTMLDAEDPVSGHYNLEVSSPGIDRPLVRAEDFQRYEGFEAKIEIDPPRESQRRFRGVLGPLEGDTLTLKTDQGEVELVLGEIERAKLVMTDDLLAHKVLFNRKKDDEKKERQDHGTSAGS